jgi:hypothetical protein
LARTALVAGHDATLRRLAAQVEGLVAMLDQAMDEGGRSPFQGMSFGN